MQEVVKSTMQEKMTDYEQFLAQAKVSAETVRQLSEFEGDYRFLPNTPTEIAESSIEGKGLFAIEAIATNDLICPARMAGFRTQGGKYTNHSSTPNAKMMLHPNDDLDLVALTDIAIGEEITVNYSQALALSEFKFVNGALAMRDKVERLESIVNQLPQVDCPVRHHFAPGMYAREITIPKGTVLTGAVHKTQNLAVLSSGQLQLVTDEGTTIITAPHILTVMPGMKNAAYALEDSIWTNFFPTEETDTDKLVELLTESKASELLGGKDNIQLIANQKAERLRA